MAEDIRGHRKFGVLKALRRRKNLQIFVAFLFGFALASIMGAVWNAFVWGGLNIP